MLLSELAAHLEREFTYPVDLGTVTAQMGSVEIEGPNTSDSETIVSVLEPIGTESFESADVLFETIFGNVSDDHIGRKYYDDRGGNQLEEHDERQDDEDISF